MTLTIDDPVNGPFHNTADVETIAAMFESLAKDLREGQVTDIEGAMILNFGTPVRWTFAAEADSGGFVRDMPPVNPYGPDF